MKGREKNEILLLVLNHVNTLLGGRNSYITLVDEETESFIPIVGTGILPDMLRVTPPVKKGHGVAGRSWQEKISIFANPQDQAKFDTPLFANGFCAALAVPIWMDEKIIGILGAAYVEHVRDFDELDLKHLESFSSLIANVFYNSDIHQRLKNSELFAAQLLDRMGEGMASTDTRSVITLINRKLRDMLGLAKDQSVVGLQASEVFPEYFESLAIGYGAFIARQEEKGARTMLRRPNDGGTTPVLLSGTPRFENGELQGSYLIASDLSDEKAVDEELKKARQEFEQAELFRAQFLAVASHELRNPLNAILGLSSILMGMDLGNDAREMLETLHESGQTMLRLISDIMDYSRLESNKLNLSLVTFRLTELTQRLERSFFISAKERETKLSFEIAPNTPEVLIGDESRLGQILSNLIANAFKYTQRGQIQIQIAPENPSPKTATTHVMLRFTVQDTGVGLSLSAQQNLFQPFHTDPQKASSNGLGLSIAKHIVQLMGGAIWLDETSASGTRFVFTAQFERAKGDT